MGCLDAACRLCLQNPQRRCSDSCFAPKYLMFDPIKAKCGARIRLDVVSTVSGTPVPQVLVGDTRLEARSPVNRLLGLDGKSLCLKVLPAALVVHIHKRP